MKTQTTTGLFIAALLADDVSHALDKAANLTAPAQTVAEQSRVVVREIRKKEDKVEVSIHDDTLIVNAESQSGIGGTRLTLTAGKWPKKLQVRLKYAPERPFTNLEGQSAAFEGADKKIQRIDTRRFLGKDGFAADMPGTDLKSLVLGWIDAYRN